MHENRSLQNIKAPPYSPYEPFLYGHLMAFDKTSEAIKSEPLTLMIGKSGYGKTTHAIYLNYRVPNSILISASSGTSPANLVKSICIHFGWSVPRLNCSNQERVSHIVNCIDGGEPVIVIDNAEKLPFDSLALLSMMAESLEEQRAHFVLVGLPILIDRFSSVRNEAIQEINIEPLSIEDIQGWVHEVLTHAKVPHVRQKLSLSFYESLFNHTQGIPRQIARLTEPMLKTQLTSTTERKPKEKEAKSPYRKTLNFLASFTVVASAGLISQPMLMAKIKNTSLFPESTKAHTDPQASKKVDLVSLIHSRIKRDEQYVLSANHDFIQVGATQQLSEVLSWVTKNSSKNADLRVVRALRSEKPYYLILKEPESNDLSTNSEAWIRKHDSVAKDIRSFLAVEKNSRIRA